MLKSLFISSFVIIDQTTVDFDEGMTALTGETGAGKSIIINALEQLCGARASSSLVRKGSKKAVIEGVFDMNDSIQKILDELNIDGDDDLIITKEILDNGRSTIKTNYTNYNKYTNCVYYCIVLFFYIFNGIFRSI